MLGHPGRQEATTAQPADFVQTESAQTSELECLRSDQVLTGGMGGRMQGYGCIPVVLVVCYIFLHYWFSGGDVWLSVSSQAVCQLQGQDYGPHQ